MATFNVSLHRKYLETVYYDDDCTVDYVRDSLVSHDGFDPAINVRKVYGKQMFYIQRRDANLLETVDEFPTRSEARAMLSEYIMSDHSADYYISTRACANWK